MYAIGSNRSPPPLEKGEVNGYFPLWKRGIEGDLSNQISPNPSFPKRGTERIRLEPVDEFV